METLYSLVSYCKGCEVGRLCTAGFDKKRNIQTIQGKSRETFTRFAVFKSISKKAQSLKTLRSGEKSGDFYKICRFQEHFKKKLKV